MVGFSDGDMYAWMSDLVDKGHREFMASDKAVNATENLLNLLDMFKITICE